MIVIGADTHKRSHALAAVDAGTGRVRGQREIRAEEPGHLAAVRWARGLDEERMWAIEDCRHVSRRLEQALIAAGERVVRVPPQRMGASRRGEREPGKSDGGPGERDESHGAVAMTAAAPLVAPPARGPGERDESHGAVAMTTAAPLVAPPARPQACPSSASSFLCLASPTEDGRRLV